MRISGSVCGAVFVGALLVVSLPEAHARPKYNTEFWKLYEKEIGKLKDETKCDACHNGGDDKKKRNDYGQAMAEVIMSAEVGGKKNESDVEKIKKALELVAKQKSGTEGKTFGDLIKEGKLPGK
jgi:hypothetical protein